MMKMIPSYSTRHGRTQEKGVKFLMLLCLFMVVSLSVLIYDAEDWNQTKKEQQLLSPSRLPNDADDSQRVLSDTSKQEPVMKKVKVVTNNGTHLIMNIRYVPVNETEKSNSTRKATPNTVSLEEDSQDEETQYALPPPENQVPLQRFAFDLVVTLLARRSSVRSKSVNPCSGFLLRDDMVLTSTECAEKAKSVDVPQYGNRYINSKFYSISHNLALVGLELPPFNALEGPKYSKNLGWPRLRMFLGSGTEYTSSKKSKDSNVFSFTSDHDGLSFVLSVDEFQRRPILSVFAGKKKEMVPIHFFQNNTAGNAFDFQLKRLLHDDSDWSKTMAVMSNDKTGERWWTRKKRPTEMHADIQALMDKYSQAPPGAISVGGGLGLSAVLKIEDPFGGRRHFCLRRYYYHWASEDPFSEEPFFQWLEYGSGKYFDHPRCNRLFLNELHMHWLTEEDREKVAVNLAVVDGGKTVQLYFAKSGMPVPEGGWVFVQGLDKMLYLANEVRDVLGHSSFFKGGPILHAGEMQICEDGRLVRMSSKSGHYRPSTNESIAFFEYLKDRGIDGRALVFSKNTTRSYLEWEQVFGEAVLVPDGNVTDLCQSPFIRDSIGQRSAD